jgi:hypothetical protein
MDLGVLNNYQAPARQHQGLNIDGIWVEFPFEPYDCQVMAITHQLQAIFCFLQSSAEDFDLLPACFEIPLYSFMIMSFHFSCMCRKNT